MAYICAARNGLSDSSSELLSAYTRSASRGLNGVRFRCGFLRLGSGKRERNGDGLDQVARPERFLQEGGGAAVAEAQVNVGIRHAAGDDHGNVLRAWRGAELAQEIQPVSGSVEHAVEDDEDGLVEHELLDYFPGAGGFHDAIAGSFQHFADEAADVGVRIDGEDSRHSLTLRVAICDCKQIRYRTVTQTRGGWRGAEAHRNHRNSGCGRESDSGGC